VKSAARKIRGEAKGRAADERAFGALRRANCKMERSRIVEEKEKGRKVMTVERYLRLIAGIMILLSVTLGYFVSPYWFLLTVFVALNLIQSAFSDWCPMMTILRKLGAKDEGASAMSRG
jgi:hypothetical protein